MTTQQTKVQPVGYWVFDDISTFLRNGVQRGFIDQILNKAK